MKRLFLLTLLLTLCWQPAFADDLKIVDQFIQENVETVLQAVRNEELDQQGKRAKVMEVVNRVFNLPLMAKLTLGRKHWSSFNAQQREEFTGLFVKQMQSIYMSQLELAADAKVTFDPPQLKKNKAYMLTLAETKNEPIKILYKLYKSKGNWRIYDVEIQGVSIVKSYGQQYNQILRDGSYEDLVTKIKQKIEQNLQESTAKK